jgi:hypothetical protein
VIQERGPWGIVAVQLCTRFLLLWNSLVAMGNARMRLARLRGVREGDTGPRKMGRESTHHMVGEEMWVVVDSGPAGAHSHHARVVHQHRHFSAMPFPGARGEPHRTLSWARSCVWKLRILVRREDLGTHRIVDANCWTDLAQLMSRGMHVSLPSST